MDVDIREMGSIALLNHLKTQFSICDANMGKLPHRVRLEVDEETGDSIFPMPKEIYDDYVDINDVISFKKASKYRIKLVNLSCKVITKTRYIREYPSICRQLISVKHPLNRVIIEIQARHYLLK